MGQRLLSVVSPCYNEQGNVEELYRRLKLAIYEIGCDAELIFIENGSTDDTPQILKQLAVEDPCVTIISFSRNFGAQAAYTAGLDHASGDCVVCLDGDLQDPPELIPQMWDKWCQGFQVVYGVRTRRKAPLVRRLGYKLFYRLLRKMAYIDVPLDAGDFSLMDRTVVNTMKRLPERSRLIRGLRAWVGFRQTGVPYIREDRYSGRTTNSMLDNIRWAALGIFSFSYKPLQMISGLAALVVGVSILGVMAYVVIHFVAPTRVPGFATLIVTVWFLGGLQLLCLSIIGQYLGRIFEEVKQRPVYVVDHIDRKLGSVAGGPDR